MSAHTGRYALLINTETPPMLAFTSTYYLIVHKTHGAKRYTTAAQHHQRKRNLRLDYTSLLLPYSINYDACHEKSSLNIFFALEIRCVEELHRFRGHISASKAIISCRELITDLK
jgi:hypothetical protein